jgi:hypothetical protein
MNDATEFLIVIGMGWLLFVASILIEKIINEIKDIILIHKLIKEKK